MREAAQSNWATSRHFEEKKHLPFRSLNFFLPCELVIAITFHRVQSSFFFYLALRQLLHVAFQAGGEMTHFFLMKASDVSQLHALCSRVFRSSLFKIALLSFPVLLLAACGPAPIETDFDEVLIPAQPDENGFWGFIRLNGDLVIKPKYPVMPSTMWQGWAIVKESGTGTNYHYLDREGKLSDRLFEIGQLMHDGYAFVRESSGEIALINDQLETVTVLPDISVVKYMAEGLAPFRNMDAKWGYLNSSGEVVIEAQYLMANAFREGLAKVSWMEGETSRQAFIDREGNQVFEVPDSLSVTGDFREGRVPFSGDSGRGFLDQQGEVVVRANPDWENITSYVNGYAAYQQNGVWGLLDRNGERVIEHKFTHAPQFFDGKTCLMSYGTTIQNVRPALVSLEGEQIFPELESKRVYTPMIDGYGFISSIHGAVRIDREGKVGEEEERVSYHDLSMRFKQNLEITGLPFNPNTILIARYEADTNQLARLIRIEAGQVVLAGLDLQMSHEEILTQNIDVLSNQTFKNRSTYQIRLLGLSQSSKPGDQLTAEITKASSGFFPKKIRTILQFAQKERAKPFEQALIRYAESLGFEKMNRRSSYGWTSLEHPDHPGGKLGIRDSYGSIQFEWEAGR
jgi:hypothetical protein